MCKYNCSVQRDWWLVLFYLLTFAKICNLQELNRHMNFCHDFFHKILDGEMVNVRFTISWNPCKRKATSVSNICQDMTNADLISLRCIHNNLCNKIIFPSKHGLGHSLNNSNYTLLHWLESNLVLFGLQTNWYAQNGSTIN